ncbi:hypothetical protein Glove_772g8 [Diversispora epigaea]|uniref:Phosphoribosyltransferase domain-containing protein n=1 Tax=Diversispora epigaea TaxID=1348612 RepID=A0A397G372_9GLOM|nr:hypothetical protein Glove_772g8 [Diversispora epigaea]
MLAEKPLSSGHNGANGANGVHGHYKRASLSNVIKPFFASREEAGKLLAIWLQCYAQKENTVVLSIKPTATLLAYELAKELKLPLDLFLIRTLKIYGLTIGAITDRTDNPLQNEQIIRGCDITQQQLSEIVNQERIQLETLKHQFNPPNYPLSNSENATVLLATDGIQTGQNARCAIRLLKSMGYRGRIVLVGGVIGSDAQKIFMREADEVLAVKGPQNVGLVSSWYKNAEPTNEQIKQTLLKAKE